MKKCRYALLLVVSCLQLRAYDVTLDGIYYTLIGTRIAVVTHPGLDAPTDSYRGSIVIPAQISHGGRNYNVISIDENAFAGQHQLESVQLPSSIKAVSPCAFLGCTALRSVSVTPSLQVFGGCAFTGCTSLQEITLPRRTETIDSLTFYCCASLTSLVLPHRVRKVCQGALEHLPRIADMFCFATVPPETEAEAFTESDQQQCTLHVPSGSVDAYRQSPVWGMFAHIMPLDDADYAAHGYHRGDVNDDGITDVRDLEQLRLIIAHLPDDDAVRWAADVNADGVVNAVDFVLLANSIR